MGKKLVLTGTKLTDLSRDKLATIDPIESAGSLALIEPGHPLSPDLSVLPDNLAVPNLFHDNLATILGEGSASSLAYALDYQGVTDDRVEMEVTSRGALGGIVTLASDLANGQGVALAAPLALRQYIFGMKASGHDLYVSAWLRYTRRSTSQGPAALIIGQQNNAGLATAFKQSQAQPTVASEWQGVTHNDRVLPAPALDVPIRATVRRDMENAAFTATPALAGPVWGLPTGQYYVASFQRQWPSFVFYRLYLEDLDVSGRTYAEVDAIDQALHAAAFGQHGRYYGDTHLDPATLP